MLSPEDFFAYGEAGYSHVPLWQHMPLPAGAQALLLYQTLANRGQDYLFETGHWHEGTFVQAYSVIGLPCKGACGARRRRHAPLQRRAVVCGH